MAWTKMKTAIVVCVILLLAAATTNLAVKEIQEHKTYSWQVPEANFSLFYKTEAQIRIIPSKFNKDGNLVCDERVGAFGIAQPLKEIIQVAYQEKNLRTIISTELPTDKFDFFAKLPGKDSTTPTPWEEAFQLQIKKQFGLVGSLEYKEMSVLLLKLKNSNVQGFKPSHTMPNGIAMEQHPGQYSYIDQPVSTIHSFLEQYFKVPIIDQTGLTNNYDYTITWDESLPDKQNSAALKQALLDQLGLELMPTNMPIEMLVVEKVK